MKLFEAIVCFLLICSLAAPALAVDPVKMLGDGVNTGLKDFCVSVADSIYSLGATNETGAVKDNYGYAVGTVFKIATYTNDPYSDPTVQQMRESLGMIAVFIFLIFVFLGAAKVNLSFKGSGIVERIEFTATQTYSGLNEYKDSLIIAVAAIFGIHYLFKFVILFNTAITTYEMYSVLDQIQFTSNNTFLYCYMAVCYALESVFFIMRILLQDLIAGSDVLIGALFAFNFTREKAWTLVVYFCKITLMQFLIVLVTVFGIAISKHLGFSEGLGYIVLILILILISAGILFGFTKIFHTSKVIVRSVY